MELRAGFCFQVDSFTLLGFFCKWWEGLFAPQGGGWESACVPVGRAEGVPLGTARSVPPCWLGRCGSSFRGVLGWETRSSGCLLVPSLLVQDVGGFAVNQGHGPKAEPLVPPPGEAEGQGNTSGDTQVWGLETAGKGWKQPQAVLVWPLHHPPLLQDVAKQGSAPPGHMPWDTHRGTQLASPLEEERRWMLPQLRFHPLWPLPWRRRDSHLLRSKVQDAHGIPIASRGADPLALTWLVPAPPPLMLLSHHLGAHPATPGAADGGSIFPPHCLLGFLQVPRPSPARGRPHGGGR